MEISVCCQECMDYDKEIAMQYTDKTIPIECGECPDHTEEGLTAMIVHILKEHKEYNSMEANEYAMRWLDDAYDAEDLRQERATRAHRGIR